MLKSVEDVMTTKISVVRPETSVSEAALIISQKGFNGLPVVDGKGNLVGLFSERNMISDKSYVHLKTLLKLFSELEFYKKDNSPIKEDLKSLVSIKVKDIMTAKPTTISPSDSIERALTLFSEPKNNPLLVVDDKNKLLGILSVSDLTRFYGVSSQVRGKEKDLDREVENFVKTFEKQFVVVTRFRVSTWFLVSLLFAFVGFAISMFLILRIA
jgi:CBS domain-containing protein